MIRLTDMAGGREQTALHQLLQDEDGRHPRYRTNALWGHSQHLQPPVSTGASPPPKLPVSTGAPANYLYYYLLLVSHPPPPFPLPPSLSSQALQAVYQHLCRVHTTSKKCLCIFTQPLTPPSHFTPHTTLTLYPSHHPHTSPLIPEYSLFAYSCFAYFRRKSGVLPTHKKQLYVMF